MFLGSEALKEEAGYAYDSVVDNVNQWSNWECQTVSEKNLALMEQQ